MAASVKCPARKYIEFDLRDEFNHASRFVLYSLNPCSRLQKQSSLESRKYLA